MSIFESANKHPLLQQVDLCVISGSFTGCFAAIVAARMGLEVILVKNNGYFGSVATASQVNIWHRVHSTDGSKVIIAGLTQEVIDRLARRNAVNFKDKLVWHGSFHLNTEALETELDEMVLDAGVIPCLHICFRASTLKDGKIDTLFIEDVTGRRAIRAKFFIDASGDGLLAKRSGYDWWQADKVQPPTTCMILRSLNEIKHRQLPVVVSRRRLLQDNGGYRDRDGCFPESEPSANS